MEVSGQGGGEACVVCQEALGPAPAAGCFQCSHVFHMDCIRRMALIRVSEAEPIVCPLCRAPAHLARVLQEPLLQVALFGYMASGCVVGVRQAAEGLGPPRLNAMRMSEDPSSLAEGCPLTVLACTMFSTRVLGALLDAGLQPDLQTPSTARALNLLLHSDEPSYEKRALLLLRAGASPTALGPQEEEPLAVAAGRGSLPLVAALLERGAPPTAAALERAASRWTPTVEQDRRVAELLLSKGAPPTQCALLGALLTGNQALACTLAEAGASRAPITPAQLAQQLGLPLAAAALAGAGPGPSPAPPSSPASSAAPSAPRARSSLRPRLHRLLGRRVGRLERRPRNEVAAAAAAAAAQRGSL